MSADVAHRIFPDLNFIVSSFCVTEKHLFIHIVRKVRILHRVTPDIIGLSMSSHPGRRASSPAERHDQRHREVVQVDSVVCSPNFAVT
ncbi:hypothetical protein [Mesorhizobium sp.]|uniref:hypothetical protein n=1 Tax=Mesorhizobium sp. TaxID=1871066 RepID=UPI002579BF57|nr:hypothetical protein [Mesorhizobium sp.]